MPTGRRRRTRASVHIDTTVLVGSESLSLKTENISLNGMLCGPDRKIKTGEESDIKITLSPEAIITARATVVRSDSEGIDIAFTSVDESGFINLKKMVK